MRAVLRELGDRLAATGIADALWVGGSLATGDHVVGVSDLDLVAVTSEPLTGPALAQVALLHQQLDDGAARGMDLGCQYVDAGRLLDVAVEHPTWTHGVMVNRTVSLITRAELVLHGFAVMGPPPEELLPPVTPDGVREAAHAELAGYWSYAARRPHMFWSLPVMVDLGLTAMARGAARPRRRRAVDEDSRHRAGACPSLAAGRPSCATPRRARVLTAPACGPRRLVGRQTDDIRGCATTAVAVGLARTARRRARLPRSAGPEAPTSSRTSAPLHPRWTRRRNASEVDPTSLTAGLTIDIPASAIPSAVVTLHAAWSPDASHFCQAAS